MFDVFLTLSFNSDKSGPVLVLKDNPILLSSVVLLSLSFSFFNELKLNSCLTEESVEKISGRFGDLGGGVLGGPNGRLLGGGVSVLRFLFFIGSGDVSPVRFFIPPNAMLSFTSASSTAMI